MIKAGADSSPGGDFKSLAMVDILAMVEPSAMGATLRLLPSTKDSRHGGDCNHDGDTSLARDSGHGGDSETLAI